MAIAGASLSPVGNGEAQGDKFFPNTRYDNMFEPSLLHIENYIKIN
jgi:hypothetical protein